LAWTFFLASCSRTPQPAPATTDPALESGAAQESQSVPPDPLPPAAADSSKPASEPVPEPIIEAPIQSEAAPKPVFEPSAEDLAARQEADDRRRARAAKLFGKVIDPLTKASEAYQQHKTLEESSWFVRDQQDNLERINKLLDEAVQVLGVSEIDTTRQAIRELEKANGVLVEQMVQDREARLSAPSQEELNRLQKTYTTSREQLDERLAKSEATLKANKQQILDLQIEFVRQMRGIGVDLDLEAAQSLLSTITGDDFVQMCVVFDNVRGVTVQLQELTEASGESLDAAKRYYGSYVVLIRLLDTVQKDFVRRAREEMLPKLEGYASKAEELILEAQTNLAQGGDSAIARQNIRSNELTIEATRLYTEYLKEQAAEIEARNAQLQVSLRDAENTYETVALSSEVASLLKEGSKNFAALLRLDLPPLRGFQNAELKAEFQRLTEKMTRIN